MASSEANPMDASTSTPRARPPLGLEDDPAVYSASDSLQIGPKGESPFSCLPDFSFGHTAPKAASSSLGPHGSREDQHFLVGKYAVYRQPNCSQGVQFPEGEYPVSRDFRNSVPQIPPPPPSSPDLPASLQALTLEGSTGNEKEFKMVDEIWDRSANKYKIVESPGSPYPFVVNRRFGKPNTEPKSSIDIKSEGLRAIVLQALEDGNNAYSTSGEEDITVDLDVLLECFPQLEDRLAIYTGFTSAPPRKRTDAPGEYLGKLVGFLKPLREIDTPPTTRTGEVDVLSVMIPAEDTP
ncbi:MAG: hypothetical protein M1840_007925 [Geoglossum simile]|nr:MAG: hypothetical protein M1840_007925 [Geoglossum simile]